MPPIPGLLQNRAYRNIWVAGIFDGMVRWLELLVVSVFVFRMNGSAFDVALIAMVRVLPIGVAGLISGVIAEKVGRRSLYLASTGMIAGVTAIQFGLATIGALQVWHLALGAFLSGVYWATDLPVRRTMLGEAVGPESVASAMSLDAAMNNATRGLGPLMGGAVLEWVGLSGAFLLGTLMHVGSFVLILGLAGDRQVKVAHYRLFRSLFEGVRIARTNRRIASTLVITVLFNLFGFPVVSMVPVIGEERFGLSATLIGLMGSAEGVGAFLGSLCVLRYGQQVQLFNRIHWGGLLLCLFMIAVFALSPWVSFAGIALLGVGLGVAGFSTMQATLIFLSVPPEMRSRLMGLLAFSIGFGPLGFLHLGWMADLVGVPNALFIMAGEGMIALILVLIYWPEAR